MLNLVFLYLGAALTALWGIAHLFPTASVVKGFGDISAGNRNILTMEWINEGATLIFIGSLVAVVTFVDPLSVVSRAVFLMAVIGLIALSVISLLTGFKVNFIPFKLCPVIFTTSAVLIVVGGLL